MSAECPACIYDQLYTDMGFAIAKLEAWLASPHAEKDLDDKAMVVRLRDALEKSQELIAKAFLG